MAELPSPEMTKAEATRIYRAQLRQEAVRRRRELIGIYLLLGCALWVILSIAVVISDARLP